MLDFRYESAFRELFIKDYELLIDFINSIIKDRKIKSIDKFNNIEPIDNAKGLLFNISAVDENNNKIKITLERRSALPTIRHTQLFWAKTYVSDVEHLENTIDTISINILSDCIFKKDGDICRRYNLYDKEHNDILDSALDIYFVELDKTDTSNSRLGMWIKLIKGDIGNKDIYLEDRIFLKAYNKMFKLSEDINLQNKVFQEEIREQDIRDRFESLLDDNIRR